MSHRFFRYYTFVGHYLLLYGRTNNVVKRRAALGFAACQSKKVLPAWFASVDADIRIGRRRHPYRSAQTSVSVDADVLIGGYGIPAIPTQPPPRHPQPSPRSRLRGYSRDAIPSYRYCEGVWVLLLCLTFEHKLVSDIQIAVEIQSGVSVVEVGAGLTAIEEVERTGWRYVQTFG